MVSRNLPFEAINFCFHCLYTQAVLLSLKNIMQYFSFVISLISPSTSSQIRVCTINAMAYEEEEEGEGRRGEEGER